ncbi:MAG: ribonuclease HII [Acholeplasmatales bacterium]|nr:ribonuclease HII [Acholeplasmatales bacterium]
MIDLLAYEKELYSKGIEYIAGTDEAGRGPLAGPVVAAAVILPKNMIITGVNDSKQLTEKKREELFNIINEKALAVGIAFVDNNKIDEINILEASRLAMMEAIKKLKIKPEYVLSDAMPMNIDIPVKPIIKGDALSESIAAASIIAKVTRDRFMDEMDLKYPNYGFKKHKGYPTKDHIEAIKKYGITEIHRKTFKPIKTMLIEQLSFDFLDSK